jgi:hypothetical protein
MLTLGEQTATVTATVDLGRKAGGKSQMDIMLLVFYIT